MHVDLELRGYYLDQFVLDLAHGFTCCDLGAVRDSIDVGIYCNRGVAKGGIQHHVGGFATYSGQCFQCFAIFWHLAPVFFDQDFAGLNGVFRLGVKQTNGLDVSLESIDAQILNGFCAVGGSEQRPGGFINAKVCGLGG